MIATILLAIAAVAANAPGWAEFTMAPALKRTGTGVVVGTLGYDRKTRRSDYWFRRTDRSARGDSVTRWTDTRLCPQARAALEAMRALDLGPTLPDDDRIEIVADGIGYTLRAPARFAARGSGEIRMRSNVGTPLAAWVDTSLARLDRCWTTHPPDYEPPAP